MNYQPKVIRCRLKTGGKTIREIREKNKGQGMVYRDFENIKKTIDKRVEQEITRILNGYGG